MYFYLYKDELSRWRWRLVTFDGRTIADSARNFVNRSEAMNGIALVQASYNAPIEE
jgi:uncharacterized protein YegP (UPF0339 family)